MSSASVQKVFLFHANKAYQYRGALFHYRDHTKYLFFNISNFAGLPDGGGVSGEVGTGVGGTVIAAVGSPKTFGSGGVVTMLEWYSDLADKTSSGFWIGSLER